MAMGKHCLIRETGTLSGLESGLWLRLGFSNPNPIPQRKNFMPGAVQFTKLVMILGQFVKWVLHKFGN